MAHEPAAPGASTPTRLRLVLRNRGGLALGVQLYSFLLFTIYTPVQD